MGSEFWNERFAQAQYAYGKEPNTFIAEELADLTRRGKILFPAEGEGRNAVYAATQGWDVYAFDTSTEGKKKALELAAEFGVELSYELKSYADFDQTEMYDVIVAVFNHMPAEIRPIVHRNYLRALKPGGVLILEGFNKRQLGKLTGGPKSLEMLYDIDTLMEDFGSLKIEKLKETTRVLAEGPYHSGQAELIQFVGTKSAK